MRRTLMLATALLLLLPLMVPPTWAQTTSMQVTYHWTAPTTGSPVDHYNVQVSYNGGETWVDLPDVTSNTTTITMPVLVEATVRVRGVDLSSRAGPWSATSDPYTPDPGPPGSCGKPQIGS